MKIRDTQYAKTSDGVDIATRSPATGPTFADAGEHELKGVPDRWRLYRVVS